MAAHFGWRVFPVRRGTKWPHIEGWPDRASRKPEVIRRWARQFPGCNWGLVCGRGSGVIVVDEDQLEAADALGLPACPVCITGSGGRHFFLAWRPGVKTDTTKKKFPGCDIVSSRAFVVLAGSVHENGSPYVWIVSPADVELPQIPEGLFLRLRTAKKPAVSRRTVQPQPRDDAADPVVQRISGASSTPERLRTGSGTIPWHTRNVSLFKIASSMWGRGADERQILQELRHAFEQGRRPACQSPPLAPLPCVR